MILLAFTVRNHKSIRDQATVDLQRPSLKTLKPRDGDWSTAVYPIVGLFGGNATGKSALLDALHYAFSAVRCSATSWQAKKSTPRAPFRLDGTARTASSTYELDFVHRGRRHIYGFEIDAEGVKREWLRDVPTSRWRTLIDRSRDEGVATFHPSLGERFTVTGRELALSRALLLEESGLHAIAHDIATGYDCVQVKDSHRAMRLQDLADSLAEGTVAFADLEALLQAADIGITKVGIEEADIPEPLRHALGRLTAVLNTEFGHAEEERGDARGGSGELDALGPEELAQVARSLTFQHRGSADEAAKFSIYDESDGTIAWLAIAVPALEVLRRGGLLLVDEIDASLHPHLLEVLLGAFAEPSTNPRHAQLMFTSHESYVLSPLSDVHLEEEQVWFTEKSLEGVTELFCLADFPKHPDANVAKRYLTGRYGGTPRLSPATFAALVSTEDPSA